MTIAEACELIASLTRQLSATRGERDTWRIVAETWMHRATELARELEMIDGRSYVHRTRTQDKRDVWIDQTDVRKAEAA